MSGMAEELTIVLSDDKVVGRVEKHEAHRYPVQRHRAISVWLVDESNHILLQKRSDLKIVGAGWWANTVCGNVWFDESYEACAVRRLKGELGLDIKPRHLETGAKFEYRAYCNETYGEHEVDQIFVLQLSRSDVEAMLTPVASEVSQTLWVPFEEIRTKVAHFQSERGYYSSQSSLKASWNELAENMLPMRVELQGIDVLLSPWTCMMILDELLALP